MAGLILRMILLKAVVKEFANYLGHDGHTTTNSVVCYRHRNQSYAPDSSEGKKSNIDNYKNNLMNIYINKKDSI